MKPLPKAVVVIAVIALVLAAIAIIYGQVERHFLRSDDGGGGLIPPRSSDEYPADKYKPVPVKEDTLTIAERINPVHKKTRTEEVLEGHAPGTEAIEVNGAIVAYRTPQGTYYAPNGGPAVTVYRKPVPDYGFEFRPVIGIGAAGSINGINPAGAALVDVAHYKAVHVGAGIVATVRDAGVVGAVDYNITRNVDIFGAAGYSPGGIIAAAGVGLAVVSPRK